MRKLLIVIISFMFVCAYANVKPSPETFEYGIVYDGLESEQNYSIVLDEHIYENIYSKNLEDIAVFNAKKERVPFFIRRKIPMNYINAEQEAAPFYKISHDKKKNDNNTPELPAELVVDVSGFENEMKEMIFTLADNTDINAEVSIYYTKNKIGDWLYYGKKSIAQMKAGNNKLLQNTIDLNYNLRDVKYIKLEIMPEKAADSIKEIRFDFTRIPQYGEPKFKKVPASVTDNGSKFLVEYKISGFYPVEMISPGIPNSYFIPDYRVITDKKSYQYSQLYKFLYDKNINGIRTDAERSKTWQLVLNSAPDNIEGIFYWIPEELIFVARGNGPFTVSYGSKNYIPDKTDILKCPVDLQHTVLKTVDIKHYGGGQTIFINDNSKIWRMVFYAVSALIILILTIFAIKVMKNVNK